jgi:tRNA-specific 2-thiouridylase
MRVVVAMSGGVDSSTVAGLLCEAGHEVIGLAMKTHAAAPGQNRACCTPDDLRDARRVADHLGIRFFVLNYEELFHDEVIVPFARAYSEGRTPNPCVACNDKVKFRTLLARAELLGGERLATGHYARITDLAGAPVLERGVDSRKDQSYFLYRLSREQLARVLFPVGAMTKLEVRAHARRLGLPVAEKSESQEICFVGADGYAATVERLGEKPAPGAIVDGAGEVVGHHDGVHHFTLGQRRGLRIAAPEPLFVTDIDPARAVVRVGPRSALECREVELEDVTWSAAPPRGDEPVLVQQRYREQARPARVDVVGPGRARVRFDEPVSRGAPGQAAVVYAGARVLGGGTIAGPPGCGAVTPRVEA